MAVADWPGPPSPPWLCLGCWCLCGSVASGCLWTTMGDGEREVWGWESGAAESGLGLSSLSSSLHFSTVQIPLDYNSHTLLSVLRFPFVLCPHSNHSLSLPLAPFISLSFYFSTAALHCFLLQFLQCIPHPSFFPSILDLFPSDLTSPSSGSVSQKAHPAFCSVPQNVSRSDSCPCGW